MDQKPTFEFTFQYLKDHPDATANEIYKEYFKTQEVINAIAREAVINSFQRRQETVWVNRGAMGVRKVAMRASHLRSEVEKQGFNRSYAVLKNAFKNTLIKPREDYVD
ncbi:hypothetical protein G9A89_001260, partial [Geosiphon pyriformis]